MPTTTSANNTIDDWITVSQKRMDILKQWVLPNQLPAEYLYFLENYNGLDLHLKPGGLPFFSIFGFFPPALYDISVDELATYYYEQETDDLAGAADIIGFNSRSPGKKLHYLYIGRWADNHQLTDEELSRVPINPETGEIYSPFDDAYPVFHLPMVRFYLDMAGDLEQNAVCSSIDMSTTPMQKVADSFAKWLDKVAETGADFSHVASGQVV